MARAKTTAFFCRECGYESSKWMGQCPACKAWNSMVEEPVSKTSGAVSPSGRQTAGGLGASGRAARASLLSEIRLEKEDRIPTGFNELDRVLGDGIVSGSLVLVGGDPGNRKIYPFAAGLPPPGSRRASGSLYFRGGISKTDQDAGQPDRRGNRGSAFLM